ncbi:MAG: YdeI/OmpD-associated family protein [Gammaproteobacteria bacterium]
MASKDIPAGVVHQVPDDLRKILAGDSKLLLQWQDITPLARNEWLCWVEDAKQAATRDRRMQRLSNDLKAGKRRPCCWPGCPHRQTNKGRNSASRNGRHASQNI